MGFGSYARNEATEDSYVDVLIVSVHATVRKIQF
jgi:predicted nucleotidyltransferase